MGFKRAFYRDLDLFNHFLISLLHFETIPVQNDSTSHLSSHAETQILNKVS